MNTLLLLLLALIPGILLLIIILFTDRNEKEPLGLVLLAMLLGAFSVVPAVLGEYLLARLPIYDGSPLVNAITTAFVQVAWLEELAKLSVILLFIWRNKNFNEENDGIVYVGAAALGFATLENIFYVISGGAVTGLLRALTAMPLHCFTGVVMGYYTGLAKCASSKEEKKKRRLFLLKGFFLAYLIHGAYDALALSQTPAALLIFPMVIGLIFFGLHFMKKGRALSMARTPAPEIPTNTVKQQELLLTTNPGNQLWKILVSRLLFTLSIIAWAVITVRMDTLQEKYQTGALDIIVVSILLTALPVFTGILLEISYRRKHLLYNRLQADVPRAIKEKPLLIGEQLTTSVSPPGQLWRIITARTLLIICGLFWSLLVWGLVIKYESYSSQWQDGFIGGILITALPIYSGIMLEVSYRKRKKRFLQLLRTQPVQNIGPAQLKLSPPGQAWKIALSRTLLPVIFLSWFTMLSIYYSGGSSGEDTPFLPAAFAATLLPLSGCIFLEYSYRRRKKTAGTGGSPNASPLPEQKTPEQ